MKLKIDYSFEDSPEEKWSITATGDAVSPSPIPNIGDYVWVGIAEDDAKPFLKGRVTDRSYGYVISPEKTTFSRTAKTFDAPGDALAIVVAITLAR